MIIFKLRLSITGGLQHEKTKEFLNNPFIKYPLTIISAITILKTGYDLGVFIINVKYI